LKRFVLSRTGDRPRSSDRVSTDLRPWALLAILIGLASAFPAAQPKPLFSFHSNPWLNLHYYVRAVARGGTAPTGLSPDEQTQWAAGVEFYKPYVARDLLFDQGMIDIKIALHGAEGKTSLDGVKIDPALRTMLERLMPIYQKRWWPEHDRANRAWIAAIQPLVDRHGVAIRQALTRVYGVAWPSAPMPVDLSVTAGASGAYATGDPPHIMIASGDSGYRGYTGLEMLFHEASHPLGGLFQETRQAAAEQKVTIPPQLSHAVLFYTAGELTRRELKARGIDYTPCADAGFYTSLCGAGCGDKIAEHWGPHLDGKRSSADALSGLVASFKQ
jgi:hypothetical protein